MCVPPPPHAANVSRAAKASSARAAFERRVNGTALKRKKNARAAATPIISRMIPVGG